MTRRLASVLACCAVLAAALPSAGTEEDLSASGVPSEFLLSDFKVTLRRVVHSPHCQDYTVTIAGEGTGVCHCHEIVWGSGARLEFEVSRQALLSLIETLYKEDFFGLRPEYRYLFSVSIDSAAMVSVSRSLDPDGLLSPPEAGVRPPPGRREAFTVQIGEYSKTVTVVAADHPDVLDSLERQIDEIAAAAYRELTHGSDD